LKTILKNTYFWAISKKSGAHYDESLPEEERQSWFAVHRLDFLTSGVQLYAKAEYKNKLLESFKKESYIKKYYHFLIEDPTQYIRPTLYEGYMFQRYRASKKLKWSYERLKGFRSTQESSHSILDTEDESVLSKEIVCEDGQKRQLYSLELHTGRRHQIRSFARECYSPILGDPLYGSEESKNSRMALHCYKIVLPKEIFGEEFVIDSQEANHFMV